MNILNDLGNAISEIGDALGDAFTAHRRQADEVWRQVAARRGGVFTERTGGFFTARPASIDVVVSDVAVHIDTYTVSSNNSSQTYTRFRCSYLLPVGPVFTIAPDNIISSLGTALGFEDVELGGDRAFDARYVVRTSDAYATCEAWTARPKQLMLRFFPSSTIRSDSRTLKLTKHNRIRDPMFLDAGIDILVELGRYGASWLDSMKDIAGAHLVAPQGPWDGRSSPAAQLQVRGVTVWVFPVLSGVGLTMSVAGSAMRELEPFRFSVDNAGSPIGTDGGDLMTDSTRNLLRGIQSCEVSYDTRLIRIVLHDRLSHSRIIAATELIAELALGTVSQGAYR